jgi:hypothetical protein
MKIKTLEEALQVHKTIIELEQRIKWWEQSTHFHPKKFLEIVNDDFEYIATIDISSCQKYFDFIKSHEIETIKQRLIQLYIIFTEIN